MDSSEEKTNGVIIVVGDKVEGFSELLDKISPKAAGFLIYTRKGFQNANDLARKFFAETMNCDYGTVHDTEEKIQFFSKMHRLINFIERDNSAYLEAICVGTENYEILVRCAVLAHQTRTKVTVLDGENIFDVDSHEARLIDSLRSITRAFNLHQYAEVLQEIAVVWKDLRTSKIKTYFQFLEKLADAYSCWDDRMFDDASTKLQQTLALLKENTDDFGEMGRQYEEQLSDQIAFIKKLIEEKPVFRYLFGTIDALCNGIRRYEKGDFLVSLLTIANSIEYSLRSRLLMRGYDIEKPSRLSKRLLKEYPKRAEKYLISLGKVSINKDCLQFAEDKILATIKPTFTYKPGFVDMIELLEFLDDELFKKLSPMIEIKSGDILTLKELNTLRNKVVHNMGAVGKDQVEEAMKLARYAIEKFIDVASNEFPSQISPETPEETKLQVLERQANHTSLDYRQLIKTLFGWM